jgi:hypothetical protein
MKTMELRLYKNRQPQQTLIRSLHFTLLCSALLWATSGSAWGFAAHRKIVDAAIHHLPPPLHSFFKLHGQWLHDHVNDADLRKHTVVDEGIRHYIDLDRYSPSPDTLHSWFPMTYDEATHKWSEDSLHAHGIGPWHALKTYRKLIYAFDQKDEEAILRHAVDLAHYISDLHVPLHTSANYDGKQTDQTGIHALWETQLPEAFMADYDLFPHGSRVHWVEAPEAIIWRSVLESHACLDSVFSFELATRQSFAGERIDAYVERGRTRQLMRSPAFAAAYHDALNGQVERRMVAACSRVSSLWYSAWVEAGSPVLNAEAPAASTGWKKVLDWLFK